MTSQPFKNILILRMPGVAIFADVIKMVTMFLIKTIYKDPKKLKYLEIIYQNTIYICIS